MLNCFLRACCSTAKTSVKLSLILLTAFLAFRQSTSYSIVNAQQASNKEQTEIEELASRVLSATNEEREKLLASVPPSSNAALLKALNAKVPEIINIKKQIEAAGVIVSLAERAGEQSELMVALCSLASALTDNGEYRKALDYSRRSLELAEKLGDRKIAIILLIDRGVCYRRLVQFDQSVASFEQALRLAKENGLMGLLAKASYSYANTQGVMGNFEKQVELSQEAFNLYQKLNDKSGMVSALLVTSSGYFGLGAYPQSLQKGQQALKLAREMNNKILVRNSLTNCAINYKSMGFYEQSLESYQQALRIQEEVGDKQAWFTILFNLAQLYAQQHDYTKFDEHMSKALRLAEQQENPTLFIGAASELGRVCLQRQNYACALEYLQKALDAAAKISRVRQSNSARLVMGALYLEQKQFDEAEKYFQEALQQAQQARDYIQHFSSLIALSRLNAKRGNFSKSGELAEQALALQNAPTVPDDLWQAHFEIGNARLGLNQPEAARQSFLQAIRFLEQMRSHTISREDTRHLFLANRLDPYYELISLLVQTGTPAAREEAINIVQMLNGRVLLDKLASKNASESAAKPSSRQPLSSAEIRNLLDDQTALLSFAVTEKATYLFTITKDAIPLSVQTIPISRTELKEKVSRVRQRLASLDAGFRAPDLELSQLLLSSVRPDLKRYKNLILIPDGPLWELPFQALVSPEGLYLIEDHAISYAPALPALHELFQRKNRLTRPALKTDPHLLLAFGNAFSEQPGQAGASTMPAGPAKIQTPVLPEAERQARALGQLYETQRSRVYTGTEAQPSRFLTEAGQYRLLHLASHGLLNNINPLYSGLVLSPDNEADQDNLLEAHELMKLKLNADLVVLSACETARGQISEGEGMIGLSWALLLAGSQTTVVSQWKVESASTEALMLEFHRQVKANIERTGQVYSAQALQQAMRKLMKQPQYRHPAYWAGFIALGQAQ